MTKTSRNFSPGQPCAELLIVKPGLQLILLFCLPQPLSNPRRRSSRAGFLGLATIDILNQIILCCAGGSPVYCRMFSGVPASTCWMPVASPLSPVMTIKNVSRYHQMSPEGQNSPWLRITPLKYPTEWPSQWASAFSQYPGIIILQNFLHGYPWRGLANLSPSSSCSSLSSCSVSDTLDTRVAD